MKGSPMARVLAVDDDPTVIALERRVLEREGYEVVTASDGAGAMALLQEQDFDLVLLDIMMPGVDGYAVSRAFRENKANRRVAVIFISSREDTQAITEGFRAGGTLFLRKPFSANQLTRMVKGMIREP
ncbi:MAG: response regulator [Pseudomonadota bacterium]